ncbi:glycerophosphodiester phosphodiesterase domain-containing protein 5-like [Clavelina lepadiformis]|uniref:glycerophosphodiester phosphodiesterase domain-containing protein 5-like n=1 Tax=Clavelina lepadiformis TaxID=159417 RepID=UPI0040426232
MDGIPFLIHDVTLRRTSDVADVFPDRQYRAAEAFKLIELKQLNAGKWFLHQNPYGTVHSLSKSKKDKIMRQKIMSLLDLANLAKLNNKMLIFDLRMPRDWGNPHIQDYIPVIVETVLKSRIDQSKVMWISGPMNEYVMNVAPGFVQVYGAETNTRNIIARKIKMLILEYNTLSERLIWHYKDMYNISIISYTSSTEWTYSLAWCQGAYAVISDDPKMHRDLTKPIFASTPHEYHVLWENVLQK